MTVVVNAEFARSYIAQARSSGRFSPSLVEGLSGDPFAHQGIDDDIAIAFARDEILARERLKRGLHSRRAAEPMAYAQVRRQQFPAIGQHDGAQRGALRQRQPLPDGLEHRLLFGQQPVQRRMQVIHADTALAVGACVIPALVREPLHVVGHVSRKIDDRHAEAWFRLDAGLRKTRFDEAEKISGGIFSRRITGPAL